MNKEELRETRKQMFAQMEQRLQEIHPKEEDRIFFEIPRPLCLKGLHLSLYPLSSDEGKIDYGQKPPCIKGLVKITKLSSYG